MQNNQFPAPELVERVARIIEPASWSAFDTSMRPYAEGRGAIADESFWYERTYRQGCRTTDDVALWWKTKGSTQVEPVNLALWRISRNKAIAALTTVREYAASGEVTDVDRYVADNLFWSMPVPRGKLVQAFATHRQQSIAVERAKIKNSLFPGLDHIANFLNALDTEGMTVQEVRSAIYKECIQPYNNT